MPSSYVSNHVHIVFSTKNRLKVIPEDLQPNLWAYMAGIAKKTRHARGRDRWHRGPRTRPHRYGTDPRHCKDRAGVEGKFLEMDERPSGTTIWMARRIFRVQRQPVPGADGEALHCNRFCYRV